MKGWMFESGPPILGHMHNDIHVSLRYMMYRKYKCHEGQDVREWPAHPWA